VRPGELKRFEGVFAQGLDVLREATPHHAPRRETRAARFTKRPEPRDIALDPHALSSGDEPVENERERD